jgi:predicted nucleotidyltransferase
LGRPILSITGGLEGSVLGALAGVVGPLSLNDIHRRAGSASKSGVRKALLRLETGGTVERVLGGYQLNREHLAAPSIIELALLRQRLFERLAHEIRSWRPPVALAGVFGSTARGDGDDQSDIDLLVVTKSVVGDALGELCASVERWTGNVCRAVVLSPAEFSLTRRQNPELFEAWRNELVILVGERTQMFEETRRGAKRSPHRTIGRREGDKGF